MKILIGILLAIIPMATHAQTTVNTGVGVAGNGSTGTSPSYNISVEQVERFDGDRSGPVNIINNGKRWPVYVPQAGSPYCAVVYYDSAQGKYIQYGTVMMKSADGTQFLAGTIVINKKKMTLESFKLIGYYTPSKMPTISTRSDILVRVWSNDTMTYVPRPDLTIRTPLVGGEIQLNGDYTIHGAILDGGDGLGNAGLIIISNQTPIPPPGGLGGASVNPIMPAWLR